MRTAGFPILLWIRHCHVTGECPSKELHECGLTAGVLAEVIFSAIDVILEREKEDFGVNEHSTLLRFSGPISMDPRNALPRPIWVTVATWGVKGGEKGL